MDAILERRREEKQRLADMEAIRVWDMLQVSFVYCCDFVCGCEMKMIIGVLLPCIGHIAGIPCCFSVCGCEINIPIGALLCANLRDLAKDAIHSQ